MSSEMQTDGIVKVLNGIVSKFDICAQKHGIGKTKFIFDIWGDTVNVASRMESTGRPHQIHVSEQTYLELKEKFIFKEELDIDVKGKGFMHTYFI